MICSHCNRVAWYYVGREFFCGQHKAEAWAAADKEHKHSISRASIDRYPTELPGRQVHHVRDGITPLMPRNFA